MIQKQALQMVLAVSESVSASQSGALRLGSLLGPTTTALHLLCPTAKNGIKSCIFLPSGYDVCTECKSAMHVLFSEFCMDQPHGRQFERPRKRGRPLTYEEK